MKKFTLGLSLAAMALAGTAGTVYAQNDAGRNAGARDATQTRAQAQERATAMFTRMDVNKDGKIDAADREARRAAMFDRLDTDKNGQISRAEFAAAHQRGPQAEGRRADGARAEGGKPGGKHWGHRRGHRGGGMMMGRMADTDKNGAVTQAEFTAAALQRFDRMDANKDGQVTKEERQAARQAMREQWKAKREAAKAAPAT